MAWQSLSGVSNSRRTVIGALLAVGLLLPALSGFTSSSSTGPASNAGAPQLVPVGATVRLDGSRSTNAGGGPLTYLWSFVSRPASSAAALNNPTAPVASFSVDQPGAYVVQLAVSDGTTVSNSQVTIATDVTPPIADAGPGQVVVAGAVVHLNGSASSDPDGDRLSFQWSLVSLPAGSQTSISDPAAVAPTFVADLAGTYVAQLVVSDTHGNNSSASVSISTQDLPPLANAGAAQLVAVGNTVQLNAAASSDPGGDPLTYSWSWLSVPAGSAAALSSATAVNPTFVADLAGTYVVQLAVSDTHGNSSLATVEVATDSIPPLANAGAAQTVAPGANVLLNGAASNDAGGAPLTYTWTLLFKPAASSAALVNATSPSSSFVADKPGQYLAQLVVSNGLNPSLAATVLTTAAASGPNLVLSPSTLNFGNQPVGITSNPSQIIVSNSGNVRAGISLSMGGLNSGEFATTSARLFSIAPDSSATITVVFAPQTIGARSALLIVNDDSGPPRYITLAGNGGTGAPAVQFTPLNLIFIDQAVGTSSATQPVTVTNTGNAALQITGISIGGDFGFAPSFTPPTPASPISLEAGGAITIPVLFNPTTTDQRSANLSIIDNAGDSPQSMSLSGNGIAAQPPPSTAPKGISVSPAALDFQSQTVDVPSTPLWVTVTNGNSSGIVISASMGGVNSTDFAISSSRIFSIAAGGSAAISLVFTPHATGARSALIIINDDTGDPSHYVTLTGTGGTLAPAVKITPANLGFPDQPVGTSGAAQSLTVTNVGNAALQITGLTIGGSDFGFPPSFAPPSAAAPINLAPNGSTSIPVLFKPSASGARVTNLLVADNASGSPHSATLTGNGTQPPPVNTVPPGISVTPSSLDFQSQPVGTTGSPLQVTITNGNSTSAVISPSMAGFNSKDFLITSSRIFSLPAGGSANISLVFAPQASGARSALIIINDDTGSPGHYVTLTGTGWAAAPAVQLTPASLNFADQALGTSSAAQALTVTNTGSAALQITGLAIGGTNANDFGFPFTMALPTSASPISVAANGGTATISVLFKPTVTGSRTATLQIYDNAGGSPHSATLTGNGTPAQLPPISVSPGSIAFPSQTVGNSSAASLITVTNNSSSGLQITGLSFSGANVGDFSTTAKASISLAANGGTALIPVTFKPSATGTRSAALTITDNSGSSPHSVVLSGYGSSATPAGISVTPASLDFSNQVVGLTSNALQVAVTNGSNASIAISPSMAGLNGTEFVVTSASLFSVAPGGIGYISLVFTPLASGARSATLIVNDNTGALPHYVTLTGAGVLTLPFLPPDPSQHSATLSWQPSASQVSGYYVYRSTTSGGGYSRLNPLPVSSSSYADSGVQSGQTYYYVVTAVDTTGSESPFSNQVTAVVPSP